MWPNVQYAKSTILSFINKSDVKPSYGSVILELKTKYEPKRFQPKTVKLTTRNCIRKKGRLQEETRISYPPQQQLRLFLGGCFEAKEK